MATGSATEPHDRPQCTGTSKQTGERCGLAPVRGATVCKWHGGGAPQVRAAAERRQQQTAVRAYVAKYGVPAHIEWHEAIQLGINESYGNLLATRDLVQKLAPEALVWGDAQEVKILASRFPGVDVTKAAGIRPLVELYRQERELLHKQAVDAGKLGLQAQKQHYDRQVGVDLAGVISRVLGRFGVDVAEVEVMSAVAAELRSMRDLAVA